MRFNDQWPYRVEQMPCQWIPMRDGVRLAARIWLPIGAEPVPALLEYIPYRAGDLTAYRDSLHHPYLAGHGYATVRVDLRGSGDSEGVLEDEYLDSEIEDAIEVIHWLAGQPWCSGRVGMFGISWGGFNALQVAARQPAELGAIITWCSTDDRYADDVHYMGGCLLGDNLSWASNMQAYNACPPDPANVGDAWRTMWQQRLEGSGLWLETWLEHQHRDAYWRRESVCEDWGAITCPVLAGSGWADGYSNAVFRLLDNLRSPRLGIIGPWSHRYPHLGSPGPAIGFLQECLRWWDQWLKDIDTGIMDEPRVRVWCQDSVPPATGYNERPGRWIGEPSWPSPNIEPRTMQLGHYRLHTPSSERRSSEPLAVRSPISLGYFGGKWCSYAAPPDLPDDQREDDGGALVFDSEVLPESVTLLGAPSIEIVFTVDQPVAQVVARLGDRQPNGPVTRMTFGMLNLTHLEGHAEPRPLVPGTRYRARVQLNHIAQTVPRGHQIRLSLSTSYWPMVWPPPRLALMRIWPAECKLILPVRLSDRPGDERIAFEPAEAATPLAIDWHRPRSGRWRVIRDLHENASTLEVINDRGHFYLPDRDLEVDVCAEERYSVCHADLNTVRGEVRSVRKFARRGWNVTTRAFTVLTSDEHEFAVHATLDGYEGDRRVHSSNRQRRIRRKLV